MADGQQWYYTRNNQQQGPVSIEALQELGATGQLDRTDLVWSEGMASWHPAGTLGNIFPAASPGAQLQPPGAQPGYPQPGYPPQGGGYPGQGYVSYQSGHANVPNYLVQAILVTLFCCVPFGIVSIVYAAQVNSKLAAGDFQGATEVSNKAKTWAWWAFGSGLGVTLIWFLMAFLGAATS